MGVVTSSCDGASVQGSAISRPSVRFHRRLSFARSIEFWLPSPRAYAYPARLDIGVEVGLRAGLCC